MARLEHSKHLGRKIRWDDWDTPTWTLAEQAIREGGSRAPLPVQTCQLDCRLSLVQAHG